MNRLTESNVKCHYLKKGEKRLLWCTVSIPPVPWPLVGAAPWDDAWYPTHSPALSTPAWTRSFLVFDKLIWKSSDLEQCWGSVKFWCESESGSPDPYLWLMDPDPDTTPFFVDFEDEVLKLKIWISGGTGMEESSAGMKPADLPNLPRNLPNWLLIDFSMKRPGTLNSD